MIIKKYVVKNMNEAMTRIRYELGKDAIIISQRKIRAKGIKGIFSPKVIEVTAALESGKNKYTKEETLKDDSLRESVESIKNIINQEKAISKDKKEEALKDEVKEIKDMLNEILKNTKNEENEDELMHKFKELDLNYDYLEEVRETLENVDDKEEELKKYLSENINIFDKNINGRVVLVGPTGVGKTTTIAKLAGKMALVENKKVGLITIDTYRIGAVEQLRTYAEIMNIPFKVVITIKEMEEAIESMKDLDVVLIDTTGRSSKNYMQISELRAFIEKADPDHTVMVVSSITKNKDIKVILKGYERLNYDKIIITKLDETSSYGIIHTILSEGKKPIAFITTGQNVPNDIKIPTKSEIIKLIMGEETI